MRGLTREEVEILEVGLLTDSESYFDCELMRELMRCGRVVIGYEDDDGLEWDITPRGRDALRIHRFIEQLPGGFSP